MWPGCFCNCNPSTVRPAEAALLSVDTLDRCSMHVCLVRRHGGWLSTPGSSATRAEPEQLKHAGSFSHCQFACGIPISVEWPASWSYQLVTPAHHLLLHRPGPSSWFSMTAVRSNSQACNVACIHARCTRSLFGARSLARSQRSQNEWAAAPPSSVWCPSRPQCRCPRRDFHLWRSSLSIAFRPRQSSGA